MIIKNIYILLIVFALIGCKEQVDYRDIPFIDIDEEVVYSMEHKELCNKKPDSIFCKNSDSVGDISPTKSYAIYILKEMNKNFKYARDDEWHYNDSVYNYLVGDCEDIASTMAKHMVEDGIDKKYLYLAHRKISEAESHIFLAVDTVDSGLLHLDYANSGYQIEERINFHMSLDNVGIDKWIKGNIR